MVMASSLRIRPSQQSEIIEELNSEYKEDELALALETTNALVASFQTQKEAHIKEVAASYVQIGIELEQVSPAWRRVAKESLTCGLCFHVLKDPVCCGNESCQYMMCSEHVQPNMRCPNRCSDEVLAQVKVQRTVLNQLMALEVTCSICQQQYEIGDKETHYTKYCPQISFENCAFSDCKQFDECKREGFEQHLREDCLSREKSCQVCGMDIYRVYVDEEDRRVSSGHICFRDLLLLEMEKVMDDHQEDDMQPISTSDKRIYMISSMSSASNLHNTARSIHVLEKIDYSAATCSNGHKLAPTEERGQGQPCTGCSKPVSQSDLVFRCDQGCPDFKCQSCVGCPSGHVLYFARQRAYGSIRGKRNCDRCQTDLTEVDFFKVCKEDNLTFCLTNCNPEQT